MCLRLAELKHRSGSQLCASTNIWFTLTSFPPFLSPMLCLIRFHQTLKPALALLTSPAGVHVVRPGAEPCGQPAVDVGVGLAAALPVHEPVPIHALGAGPAQRRLGDRVLLEQAVVVLRPAAVEGRLADVRLVLVVALLYDLNQERLVGARRAVGGGPPAAALGGKVELERASFDEAGGYLRVRDDRDEMRRVLGGGNGSLSCCMWKGEGAAGYRSDEHGAF